MHPSRIRVVVDSSSTADWPAMSFSEVFLQQWENFGSVTILQIPTTMTSSQYSQTRSLIPPLRLKRLGILISGLICQLEDYEKHLHLECDFFMALTFGNISKCSTSSLMYLDSSVRLETPKRSDFRSSNYCSCDFGFRYICRTVVHKFRSLNRYSNIVQAKTFENLQFNKTYIIQFFQSCIVHGVYVL